MSYTTNQLEKKVSNILVEQGYSPEVSVKSVGRMLCGENWKLAEQPFSEAFLENVAYNSNVSFKCVIWLQLMSLLYNDLKNECDLNSLESQSLEC